LSPITTKIPQYAANRKEVKRENLNFYRFVRKPWVYRPWFAAQQQEVITWHF
jgi:hypothetical protein